MASDCGLSLSHILWMITCQQGWALVIKYLQTEEGYLQPLWTVAIYGCLGFLWAWPATLAKLCSKNPFPFFLACMKLDYVWLWLTTGLYHGYFTYALWKLDIVPIILSLQVDAVFSALLGHFFVRPQLTPLHLVASLVLLGGAWTVTSVKYTTTAGVHLSDTLTSDLVGLGALLGSRFALVCRGIIASRLVLKRNGARGTTTIATQVIEVEPDEHRRFLFPDSFQEEHRLALERVFGSGVYASLMIGTDSYSTLDLHLVGEYLVLTPLFALGAWLWPWTFDASHTTTNSVFSQVIGSWVILSGLGIVAVAQLVSPVLDYSLSINTSAMWYILRQTTATFTALLFTSVLFEDVWDRAKVLGAFLMIVGFGLVYYASYQTWRRQEEAKDIELIAQQQGLSTEEVEALREQHKANKNEDFRVVLLQRVLSERNMLAQEKKAERQMNEAFTRPISHAIALPAPSAPTRRSISPEPGMSPNRRQLPGEVVLDPNLDFDDQPFGVQAAVNALQRRQNNSLESLHGAWDDE